MASPDPFVVEGRALGSRLRLTLLGAAPAMRERAWAAVEDEFAAVDRSLSGFRRDSTVSRLNARAGGTGSRVDARLYAAIALADRAARQTSGRFDPRVHAALQRLGQPGPLAIAAPGTSGLGTDRGWCERRPRDRFVRLDEPVDLHGIGKGLALRWAMGAVARLVPPDVGVLVEAGGDLVGRAPGPGGGAWAIGIEDPLDRGVPAAVVSLASGAVCTSSTRISRWVDGTGRERHHLIDPATGRPADAGLLAVTVATRDPAWAEVRSKELFVVGRAGIADRARALGLAAWWVTEDGTLEMTPHARLVTRWP